MGSLSTPCSVSKKTLSPAPTRPTASLHRAIDPSSQLSKGSILGDKRAWSNYLFILKHLFVLRQVRVVWEEWLVKPKKVEHICEAAGYDYIFIETVGVGQSETNLPSVNGFLFVIDVGRSR